MSKENTSAQKTDKKDEVVLDAPDLTKPPAAGDTASANTGDKQTGEQGKPLSGKEQFQKDYGYIDLDEEEQEYVAVYGGPMTDPGTGIRFTGVPVMSKRTGWLKSQIEAGKIKQQATEPPAE